MSVDVFPEVTISGNAEERGYQYGRLLAESIARTIDFYARIFRKSQWEIYLRASYFKKVIQDYHREYAVEIESIAEGASINPLWIYALNSRTEILSLQASECTAVYFPHTGILGQNWDWGKTLEDLAVLLKIERPDGHRIQMLTEPGMIGKIGMNSHGMGVCLNILRAFSKLDGLPVHILLRSILDSKTLDEARGKVQAANGGKASNILVGDQQGKCFDMEFAEDESFLIYPENHCLIHTNHYIARQINPDRGRFRSSYARMHTALEKVSKCIDYSSDEMKHILLDRSQAEFPIHRTYIPHPEMEEMGTVATVIMQLKQRKMHIKKGNSADVNFKIYDL